MNLLSYAKRSVASAGDGLSTGVKWFNVHLVSDVVLSLSMRRALRKMDLWPLGRSLFLRWRQPSAADKIRIYSIYGDDLCDSVL